MRLFSLLSLCVLAAACAEPPVEATSPIRFTEVTEEVGLGGFRHETGAYGDRLFPESMGAGAGFLDYDGDGWLDVLLVRGARWPGHGEPVPALALYRNQADGTFTDATAEAGLDDVHAYGMGVTAADYDDDGDQDFFLTTLGDDLLFRNDGGIFTEVGRAAGVAGGDAWSTAAIFFDADRDGHLDLWVGRYVDWTPETDLWCSIDGERPSYCTPEVYEGLGPRFYRGNGDGTFADATEAAGFAGMPGMTLGVAEADYDADGWPDLFVANDTQRDLLFHNRADGTFEEVGVRAGVAYDERGKARAGMGADAGYVDGSGRPSLFVGNFSGEMVGVYTLAEGGFFVDRAAASGIGGGTLQSLTFGLFLFDPDLDGDLDLFVGNGHIEPEIAAVQEGMTYRQRPQLFVNDGAGSFAAHAAEQGLFATPMVVRGAAYGDYDRDGDLDVLVTENGGPARLWRNDLEGRRSLRVRLVGAASNRDGIGARVDVVAGGRRSIRRVRTGSSYLSQSEKTLTFGLGAAARVDSVIVRWPSGARQTIASPAVGAELVVEEPSVPRASR